MVIYNMQDTAFNLFFSFIHSSEQKLKNKTCLFRVYVLVLQRWPQIPPLLETAMKESSESQDSS